MKKTVLFLSLSFVTALLMNVQAQEKGQIRAGSGLVIGTSSGISNTGKTLGLGINVNGDYFVTDVISAAPSFTYFLSSNAALGSGSSVNLKLSVLNFDGKYYFLKQDFLEDEISVYGLFGLSMAFANVTSTGGGFGVNGTDSKAGVNIGAGADYPINDKIFVNSYLKYATSTEQLVFGAGVGYIFK